MMTALSAVAGLLMLAQLTPLQVLPADKVVLVHLSVAPLKPSPDLDRREKLQARAAQFFREELGRKRKILKLVDTPERADVSLELGEVFALTDGFFEASIAFTLGRNTETLFRASASIPDLGTNLGLAAEEWIDVHQSH
jgi:hypothetical protein